MCGEKLTLEQITELQKQYGYYKLQEQINTGIIWRLEGSAGRYASDMIGAGICMLGSTCCWDYWGNYVPSRYEVETDSKGSLSSCIKFWSDEDNLFNLEMEA